MQEMYPVRGYQSSVDYILNIGLGKQKNVKEIKVWWSADSATIITNPAINKLVTISKKQAVAISPAASTTPPLFTDITSSSGLAFTHHENDYVDFKREFLIPYELSRQGPGMAKADVNNDGLEDIYIGGAAGQSGALYLQVSDGVFKPSPAQPWQTDAISEDIGSCFFDADNDGDADLYVVSGGNEWLMPGTPLQDRLYKNDGKGNFTKLTDAIPEEVFSGSCVKATDFDKDGDMDLFIGASCIPGRYPYQ
jgi:enediyne biosynthesis protein E4